MNTFPNWRATGHAMRWARRQPGVTIATRHYGHSTDNRWQHGDNTAVTITHINGVNAVSLGVDTPDGEAEYAGNDTQRILDILYALGLLPTHFTSAYRVGRMDARVALVRDIADARRTYDLIVQAGKDAFPGGERHG